MTTQAISALGVAIGIPTAIWGRSWAGRASHGHCLGGGYDPGLHLRHGCGLQSGMPIEAISKLLGHESIDTTMIYAHISIDSVREGHRKHIV